MIDIFLSRPNWISAEFAEGLNNFNNFLKSHDLNPRTLGVNDYPTESPLDEVIGLMKKCNGAIILGYPQIQVTAGMLKDNKIEEVLLLPTEWNHIETGLAYAKGLPALLIHHKNIKRGVFDRGAVNSFLYEIDLSNPSWPLIDRVSGALTSWLPKVKNYQKINRTEENKSPISHADDTANLMASVSQDQLTKDDIIGALLSWWPTDMVQEVKVLFAELDKQYSLPDGSTKKYIDEVATKKFYKRASFGNIVAVYELDGSKLFGRVVD